MRRTYCPANSPTWVRVWITRRMDSRVTMPTTCPGGPPASTAGAQQLVDIVFERDAALYSGQLVGHDVGRAQSLQGVTDGYLSVALLRGGQQKPADERQPQPAHEIAGQRLPHAHNNHPVGQKLAAAGGEARRARIVA